MTYCEFVDVAAYIGLDSSVDQTVVEDCIASAQKQIENYTRRLFEASADTTRYFDAWRDVDGSELIFDHDICSITSVTNGDSTTVTSGQYIKLPANRTPWYGIRLKSSANISWTYEDDPENAITIVGKWAYSTTAPEDIKTACIQLAVHEYRLRDKTDSRDATIYTPQGTLIESSRIPMHIMDKLLPYRRLGVGEGMSQWGV